MPGGGFSLRRDRSASPKKSAPFQIAQEMKERGEEIIGTSPVHRRSSFQNNQNNINNNNQHHQGLVNSSIKTAKDIEGERHRSESHAVAQEIRSRFGECRNNNQQVFHASINREYANNNTSRSSSNHHSSSRRASLHHHQNRQMMNHDDEGFAIPRRIPSVHDSNLPLSLRNSITNNQQNNNNFRSNQSSHSRRRYNNRAAGQSVFSGLLSAPCSPFDPTTGRCDPSIIHDYAELLRRDGVNGVFCCGTTGESMSLTVRERMDTCAAWVETGLQVCVHVGTQSLIDTQKLARHAQDCGADGIAVMVPMTIAKASSIDIVVDYLEEVYRAAPEIPMLVYHFPGLTGLPFKLHDILTKAVDRIPTVCGAKFTSQDLQDFAACQSIGGQVTDMIYSIEGNLVGAAFLGARAFVGMQFSMIAPIYRRIVDAARNGDTERAQREHQRASNFMIQMSKCGGNSVEKCVAITKFVTGYRLNRDIGVPRLPGARLTCEEEANVRRLLVPFFDRVDGGATSGRKSIAGGARSSCMMPGKITSPSKRSGMMAEIRNSFAQQQQQEQQQQQQQQPPRSGSANVLAPTSCFRREIMSRLSQQQQQQQQQMPSFCSPQQKQQDHHQEEQIFRASVNLEELEASSASRGSMRRSSNTTGGVFLGGDDDDYDLNRSPRFNNNNNSNSNSKSPSRRFQTEGHDSQSKYRLIM